jgi:hypothetical protein
MNHYLIRDILIELGDRVCQRVNQALRKQKITDLSKVHAHGKDDLIYELDKHVEDLILPFLTSKAGSMDGIVLVMEGISQDEPLVLPEHLSEEQAKVRLIVDPIDGTRGLMYDKRGGFFLAAAAPNLMQETSLQDVEVSVMTEIPTSRGILSDTFWALGNGDRGAYTLDLQTGVRNQRPVKPSTAKTIYGGFAQISRFFPPGREYIAAIEEELIQTLFPDAPEGHTIVFEDQYISSGGQLYEMLCGHDRFTADIRAALFRRFKKEGKKIGHQCHPYDLGAWLIGQKYGLVITGLDGSPLNAPLDTTTPVDWVMYANQDIRQEVESALQQILRKYELIP